MNSRIMRPTMFEFPVFLLLLGATLLLTSIPPTFGAKIDPDLQKKIDSAHPGSTWNIIILFKEDPTLLTPRSTTKPNPKESHISAYNAMLKLKKNAEESQSSVISGIKSFVAARASSGSKNVRTQYQWCTKTVSVRSADKDLITLLGDDRKSENENITRIVEDKPFQIGQGDTIGEKVKIPEGRNAKADLLASYSINNRIWLWPEFQFNGSGVIVGHIDDGVDIDHPSLKFNWVGQKDGWFVPADEDSKLPYVGRPGSHGTHTLGTLIGRGKRKEGTSGDVTEDDVEFEGVGVAPGARWISCGTCDPNMKYPGTNTSMCFNAYLADCLDFMYCPNKANKCLYRPNVISVSMGCDQNETEQCPDTRMYDGCITELRKVGVILVFSAGNNGRMGCQTINEPADNEEVITVGNADNRDVLHVSSSMGPPRWRYNDSRGVFKPDLIAPGDDILSTYNSEGGKFEFGYMTGTSMATPHVAGAIALLLSLNEDLTYEDVMWILRNSAVNNTKLKSKNPTLECGGKADTLMENHKFGFGRLRLPDPDSPLLKNFTVKRPTRQMPPPPKFTVDSSAIPSLRPGMVGVVIMLWSSIPFLMMNAALEI